MKRYGKVFIMSLLSIFALAVPVFAREMTPDELGKEAKSQIPKTSYVYVIGEYAFTSEHTLTTQDVMLAARSIEAKDTGKTDDDEIYNEMTIFQLKAKYNDSVEIIGWELDDNVIGTTQLTDLQNDKFNVRYIDYNYVKELYKVTLDLDDGKLPGGKENFLNVLEGDKIDQADITGENRPTKAGKQFKEWVLVKDGSETEKWDFTKPVTENMTLKATWYDEVNTDELLKEAESKMTENEWYSAKFDAESSKLIFTVLDRNEKNSLISNTGITGNIVSILSKENVVSLTMGNTTFTKEDAKQGPGAEGTVWSKFGEELAKLTSKSQFSDVTLGDLVGKNLTLEITVDGAKARTHKGNTYETYTIEFVYNAKATIDTDIPENDVTELEKLKYTPETTYNIKLDSDGLYKVTGYITQQEGVQGFGNSPSGFYFAYTITLDEGIDAKKAKVKVPTDENGTKYNEATFDSNGQTTILMEVKEDEVGDSAKNYYRDIIIDVDGVPTKVRIDFKELKLRKNSKTTLDKISDDVSLDGFYGWSKSDGYDVNYEADGDATTGEAAVKVKGLLPIYDGDTEELPFEDDHATGYYIAFAIKTENEKVDNKTKVTITDGKETTEWTDKEFDEKDVIYILKHLHPEIASRQFTVVVDMDGDDTGYNPYTITVDWSELKLQTDSEAKIELNKASQADKEQMTNWGYTIPAGQNVTLADGMLKGKLVEQELTSKDAFGEDKKDGFYFDFTIQHPEGVEIDKDKVEITRVKSHKDIGTDLVDGNILKKFTGDDLDDDNNLTILYRFPKDTKSCVECAGKDACNGNCCGESGVCDKVLYYVVDWDGAEGKEFLPVVYSIDYCGVTFERSSIFTVDALKNTDKGIFGDKGDWYDEKNGYSVTVEQDKADAKKYKVKGVLPIFNDETYWDDDFDGVFDTDDTLYYLGLVLKLVDTDIISGDETGSINVKFFHDGEGDSHYLKGFDAQFSETGELYILKSLCENAEDGSVIPDDKKVFTITLDLDGDDKNDYTPYTVTIDWSGLKLQSTSAGNFGNYEVATEANIKDDEQAVQDLQDYGYNFKTSAEVQIETQMQEETGHESKKGLKGKIKEQTLTNGTFEDDTGYFVPIKVEFPGKDDDSLSEYSHTWTIILNTEKGTPKTYTPSEEEYEQGWVLVLFKIDKDGKDGSKKISYKIDFDGDKFAFLPEEYTISYDDLTFETENKITYKYKDNTGKEQTEEKVVYEGETVELKDLSEFETDYRTFSGWYNDSENVTEKGEFTTTENQDVTLNAHWDLNVDAFVEDVIKNTADYSDVIDLEQAENVITMNIDKPKVELEELAKTAIPGTIAYILEKDEIKDVTLTIGDESVKFNSTYKADNGKEYTDDSGRELDDGIKNLKEEIVKGAKGAFDTELDNHEADATLDQLEYSNKTFSIKIGTVDDTVKLVDAEGADIEEADKTYTFKFDSDFAVVKQNPTSELGAKDLADAVKSDKDYSTVYVDGDYTSDTEIDITANHNVTIIPVDSTTEHPTTIKANDKEDVNYAVDIQNGEGTVTIKDLTITGGKRAELRIEDEATVIVDNIDVSGVIDQDSATTEEMNSSIIVKGNLTATNVKNTNESYNCPTISVITGYKTDADSASPEEGNPDHNVDGVATVKADGMTKNDKYCLVDRKSNSNFHTTKERYDGAFYYNDANHSKIYYVGIMDPKKNDHPYDYIQVYYYGEKIDIKTLGYEANVSPTADEGVNVFQYFAIGTSSSDNKIDDSNQLAQDKLKNHDTTILYAMYGTKPAAALNFDQVSGLSTSGNKVSGTISTQNKNGQFVIPVTLTSDSFKSGVSTVEVTDPNENKQTYTVDNANTMKLELEAIKSSKITGNKGKVYEITVDIDGKEKNEVKPETYTVDYSSVETLEEKINQAAEATLEANSFTVTKNNKINGYTEEFTYEYNANDGLTYLKAEKDNVEEYTFSSAKYAGADSSKLSVVARKIKDGEEDSGVYLNDWVYVHPQQVGRAIHEVTMLTDVMKDSKTSINAIDTVELVEGEEHKYTVKLNGDKYTDWVKNNYLLTSKYTISGWDETVLVDVELDENDKYIKSIKTHQESSSNTFDVTFTNVNDTTIKKPIEFLAKDGKELTEQDIKDFYEKGKQWWDKHIHENAYTQQ